jgi:hypothetical protein
MELAMDIVKLYELTSRKTDEVLDSVKNFIAAENRHVSEVLDSISNRQEFDDFMVHYSISASLDRLNRFVRSNSSIGFTGPGAGLKSRVKRIVFKMADRIINRVDKRKIVLAQILKDIDNKTEALARYTKNKLVSKDGYL